MRVDHYISELLYDYECVVLPGLGGFIASDRPASVNGINHHFSPPFRKLTFNKYLKTNDGLLTHHIAKSENLSYEEAGKIVDQFIETCLNDLQNNKVVVFDNIGRLHYDNGQHLVFEQDTSVNYHPEAFGMSEFVSPVIKRTTDEEKIKGVIMPSKKKPEDKTEKKEEREVPKKRNRRIAALLAVFVLLFTVGLGLVKKNEIKSYWENHASFFQFITAFNSEDYPGTGEMIAEENKIPETKKIETPAKEIKEPVVEMETGTVIPAKETAPAPEAPVKETKPANTSTVSSVADHTKNVISVKPSAKVYYIIAGSFSKKSNAEKLVEKLKSKGYDAVIAGTSKTGMFRVAYLTVKGRKEAGEKLDAIRNSENADAWILRKPI